MAGQKYKAGNPKSCSDNISESNSKHLYVQNSKQKCGQSLMSGKTKLIQRPQMLNSVCGEHMLIHSFIHSRCNSNLALCRGNSSFALLLQRCRKTCLHRGFATAPARGCCSSHQLCHSSASLALSRNDPGLESKGLKHFPAVEWQWHMLCRIVGGVAASRLDSRTCDSGPSQPVSAAYSGTRRLWSSQELGIKNYNLYTPCPTCTRAGQSRIKSDHPTDCDLVPALSLTGLCS